MRKLNRTIAAAIIATGIAGGTYAFFGSPLVPSAQAGWKEHPILQTADNATKDAIADLEAAPHDFHGHREKAVKVLKHAMKELEICSKTKISVAPAPLAAYPRLEGAKSALENAEKYIKEAPHDFDGHREDAQKAVHNAIEQIDICIKNG
jgi:hypothetical protein